MRSPPRHQTPRPWPQPRPETTQGRGSWGQGRLGPPAGRRPAQREDSPSPASNLLLFSNAEPPSRPKAALLWEAWWWGREGPASAAGMREKERNRDRAKKDTQRRNRERERERDLLSLRIRAAREHSEVCSSLLNSWAPELSSCWTCFPTHVGAELPASEAQLPSPGLTTPGGHPGPPSLQMKLDLGSHRGCTEAPAHQVPLTSGCATE